MLETLDKKYKVEVRVQGETSFNSNALRFDTFEEAISYAKDLAARWTAVAEWRVVDATSSST